ncbi:MAG: hypothetical protein AAFN08_07505 [Cyanobacteria bacterium J06559_3]
MPFISNHTTVMLCPGALVDGAIAAFSNPPCAIPLSTSLAALVAAHCTPAVPL